MTTPARITSATVSRSRNGTTTAGFAESHSGMPLVCDIWWLPYWD